MLQNLDVPEDTPIASIYSFGECYDFYSGVKVETIEDVDYSGLVITID